MNCTNCNATLSADANFCQKCGTQVQIERSNQEHNVFNQTEQTVHGDQVAIAGDVHGGINSGNKREIKMDGGTYVEGSVHTGDKVYGDKINAGDISGDGVAIGRGASAHVNIHSGIDSKAFVSAFEQLMGEVRKVPEPHRAAAIQKVEELQTEAAKGEDADDEVLGGLIQDLTKMLPTAASAIGKIFAGPVLGKMVGPVTEFVLNRLGIGEA